MYAKLCPYCGQYSYSSCLGEWICPYCGMDITRVTVELAGVEQPGPVQKICR